MSQTVCQFPETREKKKSPNPARPMYSIELDDFFRQHYVIFRIAGVHKNYRKHDSFCLFTGVLLQAAGRRHVEDNINYTCSLLPTAYFLNNERNEN